MSRSYIVRVWFQQKGNQVHDGPDSEQTDGENVQNAHSDLALIKLVAAYKSQEQAQQHGDPFVLALIRLSVSSKKA